MNMTKQMIEIYEVLSNDETLLRLLYYPSEHLFDDPLSNDKENILERSDRLEIIEDVIKFTPNTDGFDGNKKCRICFYAGKRQIDGRNKFSKNQEYIFDILVHRSFHEKDLRMYKIADRINELLLTREYSSFGEVQELTAESLGQIAEDYFGYRTPYLFGELNDR